MTRCPIVFPRGRLHLDDSFLLEKLVGHLLTAAKDGDKKTVLGLLQAGVEIDGKILKETALSQAIKQNQQEVIEMLVEEGASLELTTGPRQDTPLIVAAEAGLIEVIKLFIAKGAEVNAENALSETALVKAAEKGHMEVVALLLACGAPVPASMEEMELAPDIRRLITKWLKKQGSLSSYRSSSSSSSAAAAAALLPSPTTMTKASSSSPSSSPRTAAIATTNNGKVAWIVLADAVCGVGIFVQVIRYRRQ